MRLLIAVFATFLTAGCAVAQQGQPFDVNETGPFTTREAEQLSEVWGEIRQAASFQEINWQATRLGFAPGDAEARRLMAMNWDTIRRAERFSDIDWEATTGYRESSFDDFSRQGDELSAGPFTQREAEELEQVWPQIRRAPRFEEIDWEAVGLEVAPGNSEARVLMSRNWDALRSAERFSDINWEATAGYRNR